jgi:hypothetical protein
MKTPRKRRPKTALGRAKNQVRGAFNRPNPYFEFIQRYGRPKLSTPDLIFGNLANLAGQEADDFLSWIEGIPSKLVSPFPAKPARTFEKLELPSQKIELPLISRLVWLSIFLRSEMDNLDRFVELANEFEQHMLLGQYEQAQRTLDTIRDSFGLSV